MFALCKPLQLRTAVPPPVAGALPARHGLWGRLAGALRGLGNPRFGDRFTGSHKAKGVVPFPALVPVEPAQLRSLEPGHRSGSMQPEVPGPPGQLRKTGVLGLTSRVFVRTRKPLF